MKAALEQMCYLTTPEYVRTFRGKYLCSFQARGALALAGEELLFRAAHSPLLRLPLCRIRTTVLRRFPWHLQMFGLRYIDISYRADGGEGTVWLTPTYFRSLPVWHTNRVVARWHGQIEDALRECRGGA
jgi:hypothetical protein